MTQKRPDWFDDFQAWLARLSPARLADLIDALALELRRRDLGDDDALREAAQIVRGHPAARMCELVDRFATPGPDRTAETTFRLSGDTCSAK